MIFSTLAKPIFFDDVIKNFVSPPPAGGVSQYCKQYSTCIQYVLCCLAPPGRGGGSTHCKACMLGCIDMFISFEPQSQALLRFYAHLLPLLKLKNFPLLPWQPFFYFKKFQTLKYNSKI